MSKSKAKGTAFETAGVRYFQAHGFPDARRIAMQGRNDIGDVDIATFPIVHEFKATRGVDLATGLAEAEAEAKHRGCRLFALVNKRRMRSVADAYVTVPLWMWTEILEVLAKAIELQADGDIT